MPGARKSGICLRLSGSGDLSLLRQYPEDRDPDGAGPNGAERGACGERLCQNQREGRGRGGDKRAGRDQCHHGDRHGICGQHPDRRDHGTGGQPAPGLRRLSGGRHLRGLRVLCEVQLYRPECGGDSEDHEGGLLPRKFRAEGAGPHRCPGRCPEGGAKELLLSEGA